MSDRVALNRYHPAELIAQAIKVLEDDRFGVEEGEVLADELRDFSRRLAPAWNNRNKRASEKTADFKQEDILAGTFFDIADKVQQISESDIAQSVSTFDEDDYASLLATVLDAAYWILAGQLDDSIEEDSAGLYVNMEVYTDMLYRGFDPQVSWEESGLAEHFDDPSNEKSASNDLHPGDYVLYEVGPGQMRGGMVLNYPRVLCFDGVVSSMPDIQVKKLTRAEANEVLDMWADDIVRAARSRIDARRSD